MYEFSYVIEKHLSLAEESKYMPTLWGGGVFASVIRYQRRKAEREERLGVSTTSKDGKDTAESKHHSGGSTKAAPSEASSA